MIPARFDYEVAESAEHAIALLGEREDAKLLAGGHSLLPAMKLRIARPSCLIDVGRLDELSSGHGLGLAIADAIVQAHGGTLTVSASRLGGLRVELKFPAWPNAS